MAATRRRPSVQTARQRDLGQVDTGHVLRLKRNCLSMARCLFVSVGVGSSLAVIGVTRGAAASSASISPVMVRFRPTPTFAVPHYRTIGKYPQVSGGPRLDFQRVNSELRQLVVTEEQGYARVARVQEAQAPDSIRLGYKGLFATSRNIRSMSASTAWGCTYSIFLQIAKIRHAAEFVHPTRRFERRPVTRRVGIRAVARRACRDGGGVWGAKTLIAQTEMAGLEAKRNFRPWGAETRSSRCGADVVLVDKAAQQVAAAYLSHRLGWDQNPLPSPHRRDQPQPPPRPPTTRTRRLHGLNPWNYSSKSAPGICSGRGDVSQGRTRSLRGCTSGRVGCDARVAP
jgi:hypothetical protein